MAGGSHAPVQAVHAPGDSRPSQLGAGSACQAVQLVRAGLRPRQQRSGSRVLESATAGSQKAAPDSDSEGRVSLSGRARQSEGRA
jgi:hypothetical protein